MKYVFPATLLVLAAVLLFVTIVAPAQKPLQYAAAVESATTTEAKKVSHIQTPVPVKAVYMSQCIAADKNLRRDIPALIDETELNSIVIDIKDYSGRISFPSDHPLLKGAIAPQCSASDMEAFIEELHRRGIYVIGRLTVFQDPYWTGLHPEFAVKYDSNREKIWKDRKGMSYIDPGAKEAWNYIAALAHEAYAIGFDEINFDYIRFPSDGDMRDIYFPVSDQTLADYGKLGKSLVLREFFAFLRKEMQSTRAVTSADLFGMTTTNTDDLNIGQILEDALPNFDFIAPMVYPSHYPSGFLDFTNPAEYPYEVVKYSMTEAARRASTTPWKLRPWLQDFSLGADYTAPMVRKQIQAVYDSGLSSWMLWSAANRYTRDALDKE